MPLARQRSCSPLGASGCAVGTTRRVVRTLCIFLAVLPVADLLPWFSAFGTLAAQEAADEPAQAGASEPASAVVESPTLQARRPLDAGFQSRLEQLALTCERVGLPAQARLTRAWFIARDPHRNYLFDPPATVGGDFEAAPDDAAPMLVRQWYDAFRELRRQQANALYELAEAQVAAGRPGASYRLLYEVLHEDPDHARARAALGFKVVDGQWRRPTSSRRPRRGIGRHPKFGFAPRSYWTLETENFSITTSHSPQAGLELGERLEGLYRAWRQLFFRYWSSEEELKSWFAAARQGELGLEIQRRRDKFNVVLFRDRDQYLEVLGQPQLELTVGFYVEDQRTAFFYYRDGDPGAGAAGDDETARATLLPTWYHEATHQLFLESHRGIKRPGNGRNFWVLEGVALYMESLQRRDGYYVVGGCDADRLQFARYRALSEHFYLPLAELTQLGRTELQQHEQIRRLYSQAAGLASFFMDYEGGRYRSAFEDYLTAIYQGEDEASTLLALTRQPFATLDQQYIRFLADVDDAQLAFARGVKNLCLVRTNVTNEGLRALREHSQRLTWLDLAHTRVTDDGLQAVLANTPELDHLVLEGTAVTDRGLVPLGNLPALTTLDLSKTAITDAGLAHLKTLPRLQELSLAETSITDAGLPHLAAIKQLKTLYLDGTQVTPEGVEQLDRALPRWNP